MFKKWQNIFTTDCCAIKFSNTETIYPIFKNGYSSLEKYTKRNKLKIIKNNELSTLKKITVFLRDPVDRFISGVHTDIELKKITDLNKHLKNIESLKYYDRHFIPQCYWVFHLFKYFKGQLNFLPVNELLNWIPDRDLPPVKKIFAERKEKILSINYKKYVECDQKLLHKYLKQTVEIKKLIKEFKYVLSSN